MGITKEKIVELTHNIRYPPKPAAICRHPDCLSVRVHEHIKPDRSIYNNFCRKDIDFKGYYAMKCNLKCKVDYHVECWKEYKRNHLLTSNDKEALGRTCITP